MPKKQLSELAKELHERLQDKNALQKLDEKSIRRLQQLRTDIREISQKDTNPKEEKDHAQNLIGETENLLLEFEVEHTEITTVLNRIAVALSKMGI